MRLGAYGVPGVRKGGTAWTLVCFPLLFSYPEVNFDVCFLHWSPFQLSTQHSPQPATKFYWSHCLSSLAASLALIEVLWCPVVSLLASTHAQFRPPVRSQPVF